MYKACIPPETPFVLATQCEEKVDNMKSLWASRWADWAWRWLDWDSCWVREAIWIPTCWYR